MVQDSPVPIVMVGITIQLDEFDRTQGFAALDVILEQELGVTP